MNLMGSVGDSMEMGWLGGDRDVVVIYESSFNSLKMFLLNGRMGSYSCVLKLFNVGSIILSVGEPCSADCNEWRVV